MAEEEISMKNTKAEILEALQQAKEKAEAATRMRLNPEKAEKERSERQAVESAKKTVGQNIFSKELIDKFNDLQTAIAVEEQRLQELYGIGREVQKLALVIEAGKDRVAEIEAEKTAKEETLQQSLASLKADYAQKNVELQAEYNTQSKKLKTEHSREIEEYQYNITRAREKENNAWADEKTMRENKLKMQEMQAAELLADAENRVNYIRTLEEKVEHIPNLVSAAREAAVETTTAELSREYEHQAALAEMERKNAVMRLEDKVLLLEKEIDNANKTATTLQAKLDKAYSELRDLATKTVESAGGIKIISGTEKNSI